MVRSEQIATGQPLRHKRSRKACRGWAFGIDIDSTFFVPQLPARGYQSGRPRTRLELADADGLRKAWSSADSARLVNRTFPDGRPMMVVEHHDDAGYSIWAPRYGRYIISTDGARVRCALPAVSAWRWERLLFAQVLPLAAALGGRVLLHASAVALDGGVVAFAGLSGAGKSSLAAHLVARGAALVTDDVMALDVVGGRVVAFPGAMLAGIDSRELAVMGAGHRSRLGVPLGRSDKVFLAVPVVDRSLPLRGLYFLDRCRGSTIEIGPTESGPARLLGSSFISYLVAQDHLVHHLDVCSRIATMVSTLDVSIPACAPATDVAAAIEVHVATLPETSS